jgi:hypothetical protein
VLFAVVTRESYRNDDFFVWRQPLRAVILRRCAS